MTAVLAGLSGCNRVSSNQPVIALVTDYGTEDAYVGQLKGAILAVDGGARIVDVTHQIEPFQLRGGAYVLQQAAAEFPAGTIFVAVVAPGVGGGRNPVVIKTKAGHYFIGPDNGLATLAVESEGLEGAWVLDRPEYWRHGAPAGQFHGRDVFGPVAAHLAAGVNPDRMGMATKQIQRLAFVSPKQSGAIVTGQVIRVDRFGNLITNIPENYAPYLKKGALVKVAVGESLFGAPLVENYADIPDKRYGIIANSSGLLQISINQGSAAKYLKVTEGAPVRFQR